ncbi:MAG: hypothetical protein FWG16_04680 [Micrococcales bacterium]|nr:hypothetical protein [Micrococcales bacterium]
MTLRLNPALAELLSARARQSGRTQASLATEAITRLLSDPNPDDELAILVEPPSTPYRQVPPERLIHSGPSLGQLIDAQREDVI